MVQGGPFRCYNCGKKMITKIMGTVYELTLECPRCKTEIVTSPGEVKITCKEPIPFVGETLLKEKEEHVGAEHV